MVVAPRLSSRVGFPPIGDRWKETMIELPENLPVQVAREIFTARDLPVQNRRIRVAEVLSMLPFAIVAG